MTTYMNCTFTGADSTALGGFTPDTGAAFVQVDAQCHISANRAVVPNYYSYGYVRTDDSYPSSDYTVQVTLNRQSVIAGESWYVLARATSAGEPTLKGNYVGLTWDGTNLSLTERTGGDYGSGTVTQLGSNTAFSPTTGNDYVVKVVCAGTTVTAYRDGVAICGGGQTTAVSATGYATIGAVYSTNGSLTTGWAFDNWSVSSNAGGGATVAKGTLAFFLTSF